MSARRRSDAPMTANANIAQRIQKPNQLLSAAQKRRVTMSDAVAKANKALEEQQDENQDLTAPLPQIVKSQAQQSASTHQQQANRRKSTSILKQTNYTNITSSSSHDASSQQSIMKSSQDDNTTTQFDDPKKRRKSVAFSAAHLRVFERADALGSTIDVGKIKFNDSLLMNSSSNNTSLDDSQQSNDENTTTTQHVNQDNYQSVAASSELDESFLQHQQQHENQQSQNDVDIQQESNQQMGDLTNLLHESLSNESPIDRRQSKDSTIATNADLDEVTMDFTRRESMMMHEASANDDTTSVVSFKNVRQSIGVANTDEETMELTGVVVPIRNEAEQYASANNRQSLVSNMNDTTMEFTKMHNNNNDDIQSQDESMEMTNVFFASQQQQQLVNLLIIQHHPLVLYHSIHLDSIQMPVSVPLYHHGMQHYQYLNVVHPMIVDLVLQ